MCESPLLDQFECAAVHSFTYRLNLLAPSVKALAAASKTQLQINETGVLLMQHLIKNNTASSVVDFVFLPALGQDGEEPDSDKEMAMQVEEED